MNADVVLFLVCVLVSLLVVVVVDIVAVVNVVVLLFLVVIEIYGDAGGGVPVGCISPALVDGSLPLSLPLLT